MAEESTKGLELGEKGEAPLPEEYSSPTQANAGTGIAASSSRHSLSSGTPGSNPRTSPSRADCYWFAQSGDCCGDSPSDSDGSKEKERLKDREDRVRILREKQSEERQRKLDELKTAAYQAQKYREIQEEERRKKIEEIKSKESDRRHQVEERKKQIVDAEMERRENLLRRSQDREARIEAQRNAHRSSIGFAFGSSTPRMLDGESPYLLNSRRAASQLLLYQPMSASQIRSPPTNNASNGLQTSTTSAVDGGNVVRRRLGTSHSVDRGIDPVNLAHRHTIHESFFYGTPEPTKVLPNSLINQNVKPDSDSDKKAHSHHSGFPWESVEPVYPYTPNAADIRMSGLLHGSGVLVGENIMTQSLTSLSTYNRGRRRTDLIPTVPIHKDSPRTRSPGRAYSMTRLDQLSQPRGKRPLQALREEERIVKTKSMANLSGGKRGGVRSLRASRSADPRMSKSTSHLAGTQPLLTLSQRQQQRPFSARSSPTRPPLPPSGSTSPGRSVRGSSPGSEMGTAKRLSQSMWQLSSAGGPRPTRTSILRRDALAGVVTNQQGGNRSMLLSKGSQVNGGEVGGSISPRAASSPSRPQSSMSQQSLSSHSTSSVTLRPKPPPRKPRPLSVAGSTPDRNASETTEHRQGRSLDKKVGMPPTGRPPRAKSVGADNVLKDANAEEKTSSINENGTTPPVPTPRRPPTSKSTPTSSPKPKIAPKPATLQKQASKASPLQSPTTEEPVVKPASPPPPSPPASAAPPEVEAVEEAQVNEKPTIEIKQQEIENPQELIEIPLTNGVGNNNEEQQQPSKPVGNKDDSVLIPDGLVQSKIEDNNSIATQPKQKITTEEEAKAVLAEKRKRAREQAEREAELERQRQEELKRQEEERLRREEEAAREWEEEVERQRKAEEERLQRAIEEQQKREAEERLKKEEEAKLKAEREKAEQQAREEQERQRKEAEEKFSREEEERAKRRKRVEDIMSRTRARDKAKKEGQAQTPQGDDLMSRSLIDSFTLKTEVVDTLDSQVNQLEIDSNEQETLLSETNVENRPQVNRGTSQLDSLVDISTIQTNGFNNHHYHVDIERDYHTNTAESIMDSQCTPDKEVSTIMNSLSGYELLTPTKMPTTPASNYESTASSANNISNMGDHLSNEDNVNFNIVTTTNGIDNYPNHQDTGVTDLLS